GRADGLWRQSFYYHYYEFPGPHNVARHYGVVTQRYKLVHFYEPKFDYWELFDLQTDPREETRVHDQAEDPAVRKKLERELARLRKNLVVPDLDPPQAAIPQSAPKSNSKKDGKPP